jgi:hypothetical protein
VNVNMGFDVSGFIRKGNAIGRAVSTESDVAVRTVAMNIFNGAIKNLSGLHHKASIHCGNAGKLPVHVVTGTLRRSMNVQKISNGHWIVFSDNRIANYNKFVHNGTIKTGEKGQAFLGDAVKTERANGQKEISGSVANIITKENLKLS